MCSFNLRLYKFVPFQPELFTAARSVPSLRSLLPQFGIGAPRPSAGFIHFQCEPPLLLSSTHPSFRSLFSTSRYLTPSRGELSFRRETAPLYLQDSEHRVRACLDVHKF